MEVRMTDMRKNAFVKVSGDLLEHPRVLKWLKRLGRQFHVVVCTGGGTQINEALEQAGYQLRKHGPLGRELETFAERQLARNVLEQNKAALEDRFAREHIHAQVVVPVLEIGGVLCHVNGDTFLQTAYIGFDVLFVVTTKDRGVTKRDAFVHLPKVRVRLF
ncbi:MAG: hypothetical protein RI911_663 [Candidatus Parcubacteria bacterium]